MRKVWHREATIGADTGEIVSFDRLTDLRAKAAASPDERQRTIDLVRVLERAGDERDLAATVDAWQKRDPLDDSAISARSDLLAMTGDRDESLRVRSGLASALRAPDPAVLDALAVAFEREQKNDSACSMRIAAAEAKSDDDERVARAIACERGRGRENEAGKWLADLGDKRSASIGKITDLQRVANAKGESVTSGDIMVDASWTDSSTDLDLALIDPNGARVTWTSSARFAKVTDPTVGGHEALSITNGNAGAFTVEIARAKSSDSQRAVHGTLTIRAFGARKTIPFDLTGNSARIAKIDTRWESELVPVTEDDPLTLTGAAFDRGTATRLLSTVSVAGCRDPQGGGSGVALVTFASTGRVMSVTARGPFSPAGSACISSAFRGLVIGPFSGAPETVSRSVVVGP